MLAAPEVKMFDVPVGIDTVQASDTQNNITRISFLLLGTLGERSALDNKEYMTQIFEWPKKFLEFFPKLRLFI